MKKLVALTLALVLVLGLCATAFAATYPTVSLASKYKNKKVWQGDAYTYLFKLKSNSYYYSNSEYRSEFAMGVAKSNTGVVYAYKDIVFTGNVNYKLKLPASQTWDMPIGTYNVVYGTYFKSGSSWYPYQMFTTKLYIK